MQDILTIFSFVVLFCGSSVIPTQAETVQLSVQSSSTQNLDSTEIPPNGIYRYDIAFAEWQGKSMGEMVTIEIKDDSIKVTYEGDGSLTLTKKGEVLDQGLIRKHKSGKWIIAKKESDIYAEEVGGFTDGPAIIDFRNRQYWIC